MHGPVLVKRTPREVRFTQAPSNTMLGQIIGHERSRAVCALPGFSLRAPPCNRGGVGLGYHFHNLDARMLSEHRNIFAK